MSASTTIATCPAVRRADALRVLHAGLTADQQSALGPTLTTIDQRDDTVFDGLLVAIQADVEVEVEAAAADDAIVAAIWVQLTPGQTAVVWLPAASSPFAADLLCSGAAFLDKHHVTLAQFLVTDEAAVDQRLLARADFRRLARLAYLATADSQFSTSLPSTQLSFLPDAASDPQRLGELLLRTYEGSLDCPQLDGLRNSSDVLSGYQQQGTFAPERWFFVQHQQRDIGALILTAHDEIGNWELVYMGLVPEARGNGWGQQVLDFAMWKAGQGGARRLVLAVDESNQPALTMYQRAGFAAWDFRTVFARLRPQKR